MISYFDSYDHLLLGLSLYPWAIYTLFTTAAKRDSCQIVTLFVSRLSSSSLLRVKAKVLTRTASFPPCSLGVSTPAFLPWSESCQRYSCVRVFTLAISDKNAFFCSSLGISNMASSLIFRPLLKCRLSVIGLSATL